MLDEFDYEEELYKYFVDFGGFKVSFIWEFFYLIVDRVRLGGFLIIIINYGY